MLSPAYLRVETADEVLIGVLGRYTTRIIAGS
jgi:hypothetical protein